MAEKMGTFTTEGEPRPHRPPHTAARAAAELRTEVCRGRLASDAGEAVLTAAGHRVVRRIEGAAGLTAREVEVLRLVASGLTNNEIATRLVITPKTAGNHVEHIYKARRCERGDVVASHTIMARIPTSSMRLETVSSLPKVTPGSSCVNGVVAKQSSVVDRLAVQRDLVLVDVEPGGAPRAQAFARAFIRWNEAISVARAWRRNDPKHRRVDRP